MRLHSWGQQFSDLRHLTMMLFNSVYNEFRSSLEQRTSNLQCTAALVLIVWEHV